MTSHDTWCALPSKTSRTHCCPLTPAHNGTRVSVPQDLFQHNVWTVKTKGAEAAAASRMKQVDFSEFYKKFGLGGLDDAGEQEGGHGGGSSSSSTSGSSSGGVGRRR